MTQEKQMPGDDADRLKFNRIRKSFNAQTDPRRDSATFRVSASGYAKGNTLGTDVLDALAAAAGYPPEDGYKVTYGANEARGTVAIYIAQHGELGANTIRRLKGNKIISFHLGAVFKEYKSLRPAGERTCDLVSTVDAEGVPCVVIDIGAGLSTQTQSRNTTPPAQQAQ